MKEKKVRNIRKEIFDTIYQWGRVGIVNDERDPVIRKLFNELESGSRTLK